MALVDACCHWRHYLHSNLALHAALGPRLAQVPQDHAEPERQAGALGREDGGVRLHDRAHRRRSRTSWLTRCRAARTSTTSRQAARAAGRARAGGAARAASAHDAREHATTPAKRRSARAQREPPRRCAPPAADRSAGAQRQGRHRHAVAAVHGATKAGGTAVQRTAKGQYCWNHLRSVRGLRIKKSRCRRRPGPVRRRATCPPDFDIHTRAIVCRCEARDDGGTYFLQMTPAHAGHRRGAHQRRRGPLGQRPARHGHRRANAEFVLHTPPGGARSRLRADTRGPCRRGRRSW